MNQALRLPVSLAVCGVALLAAPAVAAPARAAQEVDRLFLTNGSSEEGKILEESWNGVAFQPDKGARKVVPWSTVQSLEYWDMPEELRTGLSALAAGNAADAQEYFDLVLSQEEGEAENRPMIVQQALFHLAYAQQRMGETDAAIASYAKLLADFPKGRYLRRAAENLLELHLAKNDAAGAQTMLTGVADGAKGVDGVEALSGLLEARLLEGQGKAAEAATRYAAVAALAGAPAGLAEEAKLGRARALLRENKPGEAEPMFRALIAESTQPRVQSGAWNGVGEVQATDGRAKKNSDRILEALYAYLRTVVQYKPLPGESTEEYERALAGAATCFKYLSELEQNPEKKKLHRDRERDRLEQLQREYPNSSFLNKK